MTAEIIIITCLKITFVCAFIGIASLMVGMTVLSLYWAVKAAWEAFHAR